MTREQLIRNVALKMDEISSSDDVEIDIHAGDNNPLYAQIDGLLNESVNEVLMKAPVYRLNNFVVMKTCSADDGSLIVGKNTPNTRTIAIIVVPSDFLRFITIRDTAFQRPITELSFEGDDTDKRQQNKHLIAKSAKPVAVMANNVDSLRITCYSYANDVTPSPTLRYIKRFGYSVDASLLDDYMIDAVSWVCAGKVFSAQGDINKAKTCDENAVSIMI